VIRGKGQKANCWPFESSKRGPGPRRQQEKRDDVLKKERGKSNRKGGVGKNFATFSSSPGTEPGSKTKDRGGVGEGHKAKRGKRTIRNVKGPMGPKSREPRQKGGRQGVWVIKAPRRKNPRWFRGTERIAKNRRPGVKTVQRKGLGPPRKRKEELGTANETRGICTQS